MSTTSKQWAMRTNTQRTMQAYVDDFTIGHANGIIGESVLQNPIDAAYNGKLDGVRVNVYVDVDNGIMKIRDRGTKGMGHCPNCDWGIVKGEDGDDEQCENFLNCPWATFHSAAQEGKGAGALGSRGLGKSLALLAGDGGIIVRTKIADEGRGKMASRIMLSDVGVGNWTWELAPEEAWDFKEEAGTEIEVVGLKKGLIEDFKNPESIVNDYILPYWFPSIKKGVEVTLRVMGQKTITINRDMLENLFPTGSKKAHRETLRIKVRGKKVGSISNLNVFLAPENQPLSEHLQGIALIKGGRQVVTRIKVFGAHIDGELQSRVYGWVDTGTFLDPHETSNHLDYDQSNPVVKKTREQIVDVVKSFLEPFNQAKQKNQPASAKDVKNANLIKEAMNQAFVDVPEFNPWDEGDEEIKEKCKKCGEKSCICQKPPPKERDKPWISEIVFEPKKQPFKIGEDVSVRVTVSNPIDRDYTWLHLKWKAQNASGEIVEYGAIEPEEFGELSRGESNYPGQVSHNLSFNISTGTGAFRRGKNFFTVELVEESHSAGESNLKTLHQRRRAFWVEQKPEAPQRGGTSILNEVQPFTQDGQGRDVYLDPTNRDLYVFTRYGPNIAPYWGKRGQQPTAVRNTIQAAGDEIMIQVLSRELANLDGDVTVSLITEENGLLRRVLIDKAKWVAASQKAFGG